MRRRAVLAAGSAACFERLLSPRHAAAQQQAADLLLVLAVDVSRSIDQEEARLQREGYRTAMADPAVVAAIQGGPVAAIAVAYVEWANHGYQELVLPWIRIAGAEDARAWAGALEQAPRRSVSWTSISGALAFSGQVLARCPFEGTRRVIDVSGDGVNNNGPPPQGERDKLVADGVTINGLPIVNDRPNFGMVGNAGLEQYYRDAVIGGPGAFTIVADDFQSFGAAIRRKLIQEIAARPASRTA